jgi:type VI secretion system protein VasD
VSHTPLILTVSKEMFPLKISFYRSLVTAFLLILLVTGCSTLSSLNPFGEKTPPETKPEPTKPEPTKPEPTKPEPTKLDADFIASPNLNPASNGRASPLMVRLYELKSFRTFEKADFFSLYDNDKEVLGADLLERDELQFKPKEARRYPRVLHLETRYIGIIAAYRNIDNADWRAAIEVKPHETAHIIVHLGAKAVSITKLKEDGLSEKPPTPAQSDLTTDFEDTQKDLEEVHKTYKKYQGLPEEASKYRKND